MTMRKLIAKRPEMADRVTPETIALESYFNLCRLADLTEYADPIGAVRTLRLQLAVVRDECGNIMELA